MEEVRELGSASTEEWIKGLANEGKDRVTDAVRWEQWEVKGGLKKVNARPPVRFVATHASTPVTGHDSLDKKTNRLSELPAPPSPLHPAGRNNLASPVQVTYGDSVQGIQRFLGKLLATCSIFFFGLSSCLKDPIRYLREMVLHFKTPHKVRLALSPAHDQSEVFRMSTKQRRLEEPILSVVAYY